MNTPKVQRALTVARVDLNFSHRRPSTAALVTASVVALVGSLALDAALVAIGGRVFPSTRGFVHFRIADYATLTTIGVIVACGAWPVVTRLTSSPRWLFFRLAVLVTLALWLPDLWLLYRGETAPGVGVLMVMHLGIALVSYNALVHVASVPEGGHEPDRPAGGASVTPEAAPASPAPASASSSRAVPRARRTSTWIVMVALTTLELALGFAALVVVPVGRPSDLLPSRGVALYLVHSVVGLVLSVAAVALLAAVRHEGRIPRISAVVGLVGIAIAGAGGLLTTEHGLRLLGLALMLVGGVLGAMGYLMPAVDSSREETPSGS